MTSDGSLPATQLGVREVEQGKGQVVRRPDRPQVRHGVLDRGHPLLGVRHQPGDGQPALGPHQQRDLAVVAAVQQGEHLVESRAVLLLVRRADGEGPGEDEGVHASGPGGPRRRAERGGGPRRRRPRRRTPRRGRTRGRPGPQGRRPSPRLPAAPPARLARRPAAPGRRPRPGPGRRSRRGRRPRRPTRPSLAARSHSPVRSRHMTALSTLIPRLYRIPSCRDRSCPRRAYSRPSWGSSHMMASPRLLEGLSSSTSSPDTRASLRASRKWAMASWRRPRTPRAMPRELNRLAMQRSRRRRAAGRAREPLG